MLLLFISTHILSTFYINTINHENYLYTIFKVATRSQIWFSQRCAVSCANLFMTTHNNVSYILKRMLPHISKTFQVSCVNLK